MLLGICPSYVDFSWNAHSSTLFPIYLLTSQCFNFPLSLSISPSLTLISLSHYNKTLNLFSYTHTSVQNILTLILKGRGNCRNHHRLRSITCFLFPQELIIWAMTSQLLSLEESILEGFQVLRCLNYELSLLHDGDSRKAGESRVLGARIKGLWRLRSAQDRLRTYRRRRSNSGGYQLRSWPRRARIEISRQRQKHPIPLWSPKSGMGSGHH